MALSKIGHTVLMQKRKVSERVSDKLFEKLECAYVCFDRNLIVQSASRHLTEFGFAEIPSGADVSDYIDFMVGVDPDTEIQLPIVMSPSGKPVSVDILPDDEGAILVIADAQSAFSRRQMLQQAANENELLLQKQQKLTKQLELAQKELQDKNIKLKEAARLQTSFLSGVSHEFRTPLTSIIGYTNLLTRSCNDQSEDSATYLSAVQRSSKHLLSLVENLLDHGKLDSNEIVINPKPIDLNQVFEDVRLLIEPLTITKNIDFLTRYEFDHVGLVLLDDSRLRQCLINIVGNAIKFTDVGHVSVDARWQQDMLYVTVSDTGPGISDHDLQKIKLPFWQADNTGKAGTGLGLTITDKIIELMGGTLQIESTLHQGTCVQFEMMAPAYQQDSEPKIDEVVASTSVHILLAEDDHDIADLVVLLLREQGLTVTHVENGALAVAAMNENQYDLVLMDIHMPIMDGYTAIEAARTQGNQTPVVVMSASAVEMDKGRSEQLGCDGYLVKPVEVADILSIVDIVVNKQT